MTKKKKPAPAAPSEPHGQGRPPGAKNYPRQELDRFLPPCTACRGTTLHVERIVRTLIYSGVDRRTNAAYTRTVWHNVRCSHCGNRQRTRTHLYLPEDLDDKAA